MTLWCCGSQAFHQSIDRITTTTLLEETDEPTAGDQLILDLDAHPLPEASSRLRGWSEQGCGVIVACQPKALSLAVDAVRFGAAKILLKPVDPEELLKAVDLAPQRSEKTTDVARWRAKYAAEIIGESTALYEALEVAARAAECDCPVLITGENGTGKELLAEAIHRASTRATSPFIPVNCPAIPKELVESELFGHAKGAFTGATMARIGRFAAADNGTLLLDEIGEMDLSIQSKLLRVLQDYQITKVGESRPQQVNVRVIAATNRDLEDMATRGLFREDLFYRLNVLQIHLPSLRERREDIPVLIDHFLESISQQRKVPAPKLTSRAQEALVAYHWPGNIRQLRNIIERLVILQRGETVDVKHLPLCVTRTSQQPEVDGLLGAVHLPADGIDLREALQRFEDTMIRQALLTTGGNKNQAAKILGLNRTTLVEKLRKRSVAEAV
jgi:DNA-binding NtrC family response regulator